MRAVAEAGRDDIALYTGNDDNIVARSADAFRFDVDGRPSSAGSSAGCWATGRSGRTAPWSSCSSASAVGRESAADIGDLLRRSAEVTDSNAAFFDAANGFAGCIAGLHEVLRRQGLLEGIWCLDPHETLSPGQAEEITRVWRAYPHLNDDAFVREGLEHWLTP